MRRFFIIIAVGSIVGLSACDEVNTDLERAVVGAAIGCAAGEVLADGRCVEGAVVGAGVGVLTN
ncbi:hypothetical protein ACFFUT_06855 [Pseudohalocynthiibacter aestuariivivens]|jgi:hypothetical protein|uniref:YMGG-like Gly-zipper domain-containing protein n=1 Tax=Pseudohalocynthiibacter aestuariivivens TaxID=1591409 RepID=A0ABV5JFE4_9RHOB|nr:MULTISPECIES: hypothetical protein [Pseudohalocynthiibacter]MBS9719059.1 hypothetical protein [Pseudohalocynthiibacter aestuariivivens]MCK0104615.1 hypothetical protein [Pseudohalocynthiibacter sp. F2068]